MVLAPRCLSIASRCLAWFGGRHVETKRGARSCDLLALVVAVASRLGGNGSGGENSLPFLAEKVEQAWCCRVKGFGCSSATGLAVDVSCRSVVLFAVLYLLAELAAVLPMAVVTIVFRPLLGRKVSDCLTVWLSNSSFVALYRVRGAVRLCSISSSIIFCRVVRSVCAV